jgi:hypothetical protein
MSVKLYVDDILIVSDNIDIIRDLKDEFKRNFQMKNLGEVKKYLLGMRVSWTQDTFRLDQTKICPRCRNEVVLADVKGPTQVQKDCAV